MDERHVSAFRGRFRRAPKRIIKGKLQASFDAYLAGMDRAAARSEPENGSEAYISGGRANITDQLLREIRAEARKHLRIDLTTNDGRKRQTWVDRWERFWRRSRG